MIKRFVFLLLFIFFLTIRLYPIADNRFPFAYDNAKDTLSMQYMWDTKKPTFLGPVTSLEGLYQGPLWYYMALPANVLLSFHPFASVLTVLVLASATLYLLYFYVGPWEAFFFTIGTGFITTHQTAWAPYIIQFPILFLTYCLWRYKKKISNLDTILIACALGALFHFEIAFGTVFLPLFLILLWRNKKNMTHRQILLGVFVCMLFFIPHLLFEVKHNFLQTKGVIHFVTHFKTEQAKVTNNLTFPERVADLSQSLISTIPQAVAPIGGTAVTTIVVLLVIIATILKKDARVKKIAVPLIIGIFIAYLVLPYKPFYLISLLPLWILLAGMLVRSLPKPAKLVLLLVCLLGASWYAKQSSLSYKKLANTNFFLFTNKLQAVQAAYQLADDKPFASYQYVPEVYDFTYQVAYLYTAKVNRSVLPTEFGYLPGQTAYNPWNNRTEHTQDLQTLIVEKDDRPHFFANWWDTMTKGRQIVATVHVNDVITVYLTKPAGRITK